MAHEQLPEGWRSFELKAAYAAGRITLALSFVGPSGMEYDYDPAPAAFLPVVMGLRRFMGPADAWVGMTFTAPTPTSYKVHFDYGDPKAGLTGRAPEAAQTGAGTVPALCGRGWCTDF